MHYSKSHTSGFILPALVVFSLVLMSAGLISMQYIASSTNAIQTTFYNNLAKEAANAGAVFAYQCLRTANTINNVPWQGNTLAPNYDCNGYNQSNNNLNIVNAGIPNTPENNNRKGWLNETNGPSIARTSFDVLTPSTIITNPSDPDIGTSGARITVIGKVQFFYAGSTTPTRTIEQRTIVNIPFNLSASNVPIAQGKAITEIASGMSFHCAVANQELNCWGINDMGQLGIDECIAGIACGGTFSGGNTTPTRNNLKHLANKRVENITAGGLGACAVAEGRGYCWGSNSRGQIGNNETTFLEVFNSFNPFVGSDIFFLGFDDLFFGQRFQPTEIRGDLLGQNITKLSFGKTVGLVPDRQSVCGISNGKIYCWGSNAYAQLGQPAISDNFGGTQGNFCLPFLGCMVPPAPAMSCNGWSLYNWTPPSIFAVFGSVTTRYLCAGPAATAPSSFGGVLGGTAGNEDSKKPIPVFGFGNRSFDGNQGNREQDPSIALFAGKRAQDVSTGATGTCAIVNGGQVYCWGDILLGSGIRNYSDGAYGLTTRNANARKLGTLSSARASQLTLGNATGCALAQGNVHCWGRIRGTGADSNNNNPTLVPLPTGTVIDTIGTSGELAGFICATGRGNGYCWGKQIPTMAQNYFSPVTISEGNFGLPQGKITTAGTGTGANPSEGLLTGFGGAPGSTCLLINATAYCAGNNIYGQLGRGNKVASDYTYGRTANTIGITSGEAATAISAGDRHTCAIINAQPFCWGANGSGQLGTGNATQQARPTSVFGLSSDYTTTISAGRDHSCSVTDGRAYCWGANGSGQLGDGTTTASNIPVQVPALSSMATTDISAGTNHTCAVADNDVYCWGANGSGQLGQGNANVYTTPVRVNNAALNGKLVTKVSTGNNFTCAIADGVPYCWGANGSGQLGRGNTTTTNAVQHAIAEVSGIAGSGTNLNTITDISAGDTSACAVAGGFTQCWGARSNGRIGNGGSASGNSTTPVSINAPQNGRNNDTTSLSTGTGHTCSATGGYLQCWGANGSGQLGRGNTTESLVPAAVTEANAADRLGEQNKPTRISAGTNHTCAIANAKIFCWGNNTYGQLGTGVSGGSDITTPTLTTTYSRDVVEVAWDDTVFY